MGSNSPLRVAIIGGGLAGAAAYRGLSRHSHLRVDIFESAPAFRETGQAIGFNHNGILAIERLGLKSCLEDAGAVRLTETMTMIGSGPEKGSHLISRPMRASGTWVTQRAAFLEQLLKKGDPATMHAGKKVSTIEDINDTIHVTFEDGSKHVCDVLLGADGLHSRTRKYVLSGDASTEPAFAGWWIVWMMKPYEEAIKYIGHLIDPKDPKQLMWVGDRSAIMHDLTSNGTMVQCVIVERVDEKIKPDWRKEISRDELRVLLKDWEPRLSNGMIDLVTENGKTSVPMMPFMHHLKPTPTTVRGTVGLVGDAAGATTPWLGSGGGIAMEEASLLTNLFASCHTVADAKAALVAFDAVSRPRRHSVISRSYDGGLMMTGSYPGVWMDTEKLLPVLEPIKNPILDVDLNAMETEAKAIMKK